MSSPSEVPTHAGVIAYRRNGNGFDVLLITALGSGRWVIPKGHIEPGLSPLESARKEAYEEAGLRGRIMPSPVGTYRHLKRQGSRLVEVYLMEVTEELSRWPEQSARTRRWMPMKEAVEAVLEGDLKTLLHRAQLL